MASSQTTEQLLAQLANFTAMGQLANLTPEQLAKFTPEQLNIFMGVHPTGASTAVPVQLVAPPVAGGSDSSGNMKVSQDTVQNDSCASEGAALTPEKKATLDAKDALQLHFKKEVKPLLKLLKKKFGENAFFDKSCNKPKPGYDLEAPEQVKLNTAQARYDELAELYQGKVDILKTRNRAESRRKAAEKKAAKQQLLAKQSPSDEDGEEDSGDDSEDGNRGTKRKADERDEEEDEEDEEQLPGMKRKRKAYTVEGEAAAGKRDAVLDEFSSDEEDDFGENRNEPLPEKIDYERTTDPKTGQLKITMSVDDLQQIIGHMENVRPPVVEAWKCKTMYKAGFMSHLSPYAEDWQPGKSLKVQELTEQTSELHREKKAVGKLHKALPTIKVSFTGQDAEVIQLAHDVAILGVPVSGNATKGPGAPEQVLVYSSKPDAPVSEQEPDKKKNRKPTPKHIAEAATAGPSKTPISVD